MKTESASSINRSFAPLTGKVLHTLVLGSMPGQQSLELQQYYAHPRNALWPILCALVNGSNPDYGVHQALSYSQRCNLVTSAGFGLWDVLATCNRRGSLDAHIERDQQTANNIGAIVNKHPELRLIACNGRTAETLFLQHILPTLEKRIPRLVYVPSTSPAMAALSLEAKFNQWREKLNRETRAVLTILHSQLPEQAIRVTPKS